MKKKLSLSFNDCNLIRRQFYTIFEQKGIWLLKRLKKEVIHRSGNIVRIEVN